MSKFNNALSSSDDDFYTSDDEIESDTSNNAIGSSKNELSNSDDSDKNDDSNEDGIESSEDETLKVNRKANVIQESGHHLWKNDVSLADMMKIRDKVGIKSFNKNVLGVKAKQKNNSQKQKDLKRFKRENKHRPPEVSSKIKVPFLRKVVAIKQKHTPRDPRFDDLCGSKFSEDSFNDSYQFLDDIRDREMNELQSMLQDETDPAKKRKLAYLLQRMRNQQHAKKFRAMERDVEKEWYKEEIAKVEKGIKRPHYLTKTEKKELIEKKKTQLLKESGKLAKAEAKKEKRLRAKQIKSIPKRRNFE